MSWSTPFTAVAGTPWKAADWNTYGRDNLAWLATDSPACRVYKSSAFSHNSSGNYLPVTFDQERSDNAAMHSTSSNTDRITAPTGGGGKYLMGCGIAWATSGAGTERATTFRVNGTSTLLVKMAGPPSAGAAINQPPSTVYALSAADYVTCEVWQDSGGTISVSSGANYSPEFWAFWYRT